MFFDVSYRPLGSLVKQRELELESTLELEPAQSHMTQRPMPRGEVGARALRNPVGREGGGERHVFLRAAADDTYKRARRGVVGRARLHVL